MIFREFITFKHNGKLFYVLARWSGPTKRGYKGGYRILRLNWGCKKPLSKKSLLLFGTYLGLVGKGSMDTYDVGYLLEDCSMAFISTDCINVDSWRLSGWKIDLIKLLTKNHVKHSKR